MTPVNTYEVISDEGIIFQGHTLGLGAQFQATEDEVGSFAETEIKVVSVGTGDSKLEDQGDNTTTEESEVEATDDEVESFEEVETATYKIIGENADKYDEQMNIVGVYTIDEVVALPVEYGEKLVEDGRAERVAVE